MLAPSLRALLIFVSVMVQVGTVARAQTPGIPVPADTAKPGFLHLVRPSGPAFLIVNGDYQTAIPVSANDTIPLPPGLHMLTLATDEVSDIEFGYRASSGMMHQIRIRYAPGDRSAMVDKVKMKLAPYSKGSSYPVLSSGVNLILRSDYDSEIYLDGRPVGREEVRLLAAVGKHDVEVRSPVGESRRRIITVPSAPIRLNYVDMYVRPDRTKTLWLASVPGASQFYTREPLKGGILLAFAGVSLGTAAKGELDFLVRKKEFERIRKSYEVEQDEHLALQLGDSMAEEHRRARSASSLRNTALAATAVVYALSLADAIIAPGSGFRKPGGTDHQSQLSVGPAGAGLSVSISF